MQKKILCTAMWISLFSFRPNSFRSPWILACVFLITCIAPTVLAQFGIEVNKEPESPQSKKVFAAIELAKMAAEANQPEVSFEAIRRATSIGPVINKVDLGGLLSAPQQNSSIMFSSNANEISPQQSEASKAAAKIIEVSELWAQKNFDANLAFELWFGHVFPKESPSVIHLHSQFVNNTNQASYSNFMLTGSTNKPPKAGAQCLIEWGTKVEKLNAIEQELTKRLLQPGNADLGWLFNIWLADAKKAGAEEYEAILTELEPKLATQIVGLNSELKTHAIRESLKKLPSGSELKNRIKKTFLKALPTTSNWNGNPNNMGFLQDTIADAIESNEVDSVETIAEAVVSQWTSIRSGNESYVSNLESQAFIELSRAAFEKQAYQMGSVWMQRASFGAKASNEEGNWFSLRNDSTQHLLMCPQNIRYEMLSQHLWSAPILGLNNMSSMMPQFLTATLFRKDSKSALHQLADPKAKSVSALEWLMRDAIAIGKQVEIEMKIAALEESKSDDLSLAKFIWAKANNQPIDVKTFTKAVAADGENKATTRLERLVPADSPPLPIEVEIAELAIQNPLTQSCGIEFTQTLLESCLKHNKTALISQCRTLLHSAQSAAGKSPITHERLKHFVEGSDWDGGAILDGIPSKPIWVARNESQSSWGHESSTMQSYLFLKYPLTGDFEIEFKAHDGSYAEPGIAIGGILAEFCPNTKTVDLSSIGYRHIGSASKKFGHYKQSEWNEYRIHRSANGFGVFVNGKEAVSIPAGQSASPFVGLGATSYRSSSFDELKISGKPEIPRVVELCAPRLSGWSSYYTQQYLEPIQLVAKNETADTSEEGIDEDENGQQGYDFDSEESQTFPYWVGQESGDADYAWTYKDNVLESTDQKVAWETRLEDLESKGTFIEPYVREMISNAPKKVRNIGFLHYQRPLCNGETIELEFYQDSKPEPIEGKSRSLPLSISPAIGRIAMLLDQPDVALRWVVGEGEEKWLGTDPESRVCDPQARQLGKALIKEREWNAMKIRWNQGVATLSVNGLDVYERKWETNVPPQFGLYHNPNQSQVRVRNVRLSGNWPEILPENLFELVP